MKKMMSLKMSSLFDELGLEGIVFLLILVILIIGFKFSVEWSVVVGFIGAVITFILKKTFNKSPS